MARIAPFQPYRYTPAAGDIGKLVTQPYDKISPEMRTRYLAQSPYNLVRVILGEKRDADNEQDNVYTRAAAYLNEWIASGVLAREATPSLYAYFQHFTVPDTGEKLVRKSFIGLGAVEDYLAGIVHRHEYTLAGPKKDRRELLRHTHAHFGQIFMLYPDPQGEVDRLLDEASAATPAAALTDEYGATHRLWKISDPERIARIQALMADKKLLIADGHHRYETALAFRGEHPELPGAEHVMMTFVNMHSGGLKILATHRLVNNLPGFDAAAFLQAAEADFTVTPAASLDALHAGCIGVAIGARLYILELREQTGKLDVEVLHEILLGKTLGIGEDAVKNEKNLRYLRGLDKAVDAVRRGDAQIAFLLHPASVQQVADISFGGGVMPQKSTDFYPKLLTGLTLYKLD